MDAREHPASYDIKREYATSLNVNSLFRKYNTPDDLDILSIDVDGQDFLIWLALWYRPILYIVENNPYFADIDEARTVPFDPTFGEMERNTSARVWVRS